MFLCSAATGFCTYDGAQLALYSLNLHCSFRNVDSELAADCKSQCVTLVTCKLLTQPWLLNIAIRQNSLLLALLGLSSEDSYLEMTSYNQSLRSMGISNCQDVFLLRKKRHPKILKECDKPFEMTSPWFLSSLFSRRKSRQGSQAHKDCPTQQWHLVLRRYQTVENYGLIPQFLPNITKKLILLPVKAPGPRNHQHRRSKRACRY
jgi:hypothetical protein